MKALLATGNVQLTHTQDSGRWKTDFPQALMEARQELTQEQPIVEEKENVAIKEFYNSLTKEEKIKLGTLDKIIDDYNQIPFEISEKEYIDQLNCKK